MSLWRNRSSYTKSKKWPVVPFRLTQYEETEQFKVIYKIGLHKNLVMGWTTNLSESIIPPHPVMVWEKKSVSLQKEIGGCEEYDPLETKLYYNLLSPVCNFFRKNDEDFKNRCSKQDENVVDMIFRLMDQVSSRVIDMSQVPPYFDIDNTSGHCSDKKIRVYKKEAKNGRIYFEYRCPCMNLTEMVFPVIYEDIIIALVVIGQIVDDLKLFKDKIIGMSNIPEKKKKKIIGNAKFEEKVDIVITVFDQIAVLEEEYSKQVDGERRKIMNGILEELMRIFLQTPANNNDKLKDFIQEDVDIIIEAKNYLIKEIGVEDIPIYLDKCDLLPIVYKDGLFYQRLLEDIKNGKKNKTSWYDGLDKVGDLFYEEKTPRFNEGMRPNLVFEESEKKDKWTFFIMVPSLKDEPIVIGINYKGKKRFLRNGLEKATQFERYLIPKFALLVHNILLRLESQKRSILLTQNRERLSHEVGQIAVGIRALNKKYSNIFFEEKNGFYKYSRKKDYDALERTYEAFIEKSILYKDDVESQFQIVEMLAKIHGDDIVPEPRRFDIWTEFFNRWHLIFNAQCMVNNQYLVMLFGQRDNSARSISTDPLLLQCAIYNVVNNAIKYSYVNTKITVDFNKTFEQGKPDTETYMFTVENYGSYLDPNDTSIYEMNVRQIHGKGTVSFRNESVIAGEGVGLYWTDMLIKKLGGKVYHRCDEEPICKYHVPLMEPFFTRYHDYPLFCEFWDKAKGAGLISHNAVEPSYQDIEKEYKRLTKSKPGSISEYEKIVSEWSGDALNDISLVRLCTDMSIPTYKISFFIEIPKFEKEENK